MEMAVVYRFLDPFLIWFFRITGFTFVDFLIGTYVLTLIAVVIGEFTISFVYLVNRKSIEKTTDEVVRYQNLSVDAIEAGNKPAYKASNKLANDAFGRSFFTQIAMCAGFLWPIPFALGWMQTRFSEVEFRIVFTDWTVGYAFAFFPLYVLAYLSFKRIKYRLPYFKGIKERLDAAGSRHQHMRSFDELLPDRKAKETART